MGAFGFGDALEFKPGDAYLSWVTGDPNENDLSSYQYNGLFNAATNITNSTASLAPVIFAARDFTGIPGVRLMQVYGTALSSVLGGSTYISYPHQIDNGFYMTPALLVQGSPPLIRGRMPGYYEPLHGTSLPNTQIIDNVVGFTGRKFMMLWGKNGSSTGAAVVDITGPWDS
jgi:hypothetical protein